MTLDLRQYTQKTRVTDGAWGTQLQKLGLPGGYCPELWNVENPSAVEAVAASYVQAGSDVILTNTFGANKFVLGQHSLAARVMELAQAGVKISKKATAGTDVKVFASLGPTGKIVMMGEASEDEIVSAYREAAVAVADGGADAIVLETFNELDEIRLALQGCLVAGLPVVASMTFASGPDKTSTMMGNTPAELAQMAQSAGGAAVGANCGVGPDNYVVVARMLSDACALPIWIKANAGLPVVHQGKTTFPMNPQQFAAFAPQLIAAGAKFIGGCCGTTPQHIKTLRQKVG